MYTSLDKANNSKDSKTKKSKLKAQELKSANSNNSLRPDLGKNTETSNKTQKKKKKHWK